jgi:GxxExxY protein
MHLQVMLHGELTRRVIGCFHDVYNELGHGLPEAVYAAALEIVLREAGINVLREHGIRIDFRGHVIGTYRLDFLVEEVLILELKAGVHLPPGSRAQLVTYLRITRRHVGLLLFFGPTPEVQRVEL